MEIAFTGDGGKGTATLEIESDGVNTKATYAYLDYSGEDGPHEKQKQIAWGKEKDLQLKQIFTRGVLLPDTLLCTITSTYRLKHFPHSVTFTDEGCVMTEVMEALLK